MPEVIDLTARDDPTRVEVLWFTRVGKERHSEWFVGNVLHRLKQGTVVDSNDQVACRLTLRGLGSTKTVEFSNDVERGCHELQGPFWYEVKFVADGIQMAIDLDPGKMGKCWRRLCEPMASESDSSESDSDKTSTNGYELSASSSDSGESDDSDDEQIAKETLTVLCKWNGARPSS